MHLLLNDDHSTKQVRFDTHSFGASVATTTIHQQDLDRRQEQKSSAESVGAVSPGGQSNSNHRHHQIPTARSSSNKSGIKLPRYTSKYCTPSSSRNKDHHNFKSETTGTPSKKNVMHPPTSILKNSKYSPRPASLTETIMCATAGLLSLRPLLAPNTTTTSPFPTTTIKGVTWSDVDGTNAEVLVPVSVSPSSSCSNSQPSLSSLPEKDSTTNTLSSDWDVMFLNHVATPLEERSRAPADLQAGQIWLHQRRLLRTALKNGKYKFVDQFQQVQASSRFNLLEMMGVEM